MKTITFPCWTNFGSGDSVDWEIDIEITDEEYGRLLTVIQNDPEDFFYENNDLNDIYRKVYKEAVDVATADILSYDEDLAEQYGADDDWKADYLYCIGVAYPEL